MPLFHPQVHEELARNQDRFVWEAPAHERHERGPRWYLLMAAAALLLTAYAVWTANFLFAFFILLAAIVLILGGNEEPHAALAQVGDNGVVWDGKLYFFHDLDHFAIVYQPPAIKVLYLEPASALRPRLRIPLEDQDPLELRDHLKRYLREDLDLREEHFSDILGRLLRI